MEKKENFKEQEIFIDENGILKCQTVYHTNVCIINEIIVRGDLEIIVMTIIRNLEDDDETTICIEIYNKNNVENDYMSFSCEYNDLESYQFDEHLKSQIDNTLALSDKYRL